MAESGIKSDRQDFGRAICLPLPIENNPDEYLQCYPGYHLHLAADESWAKGGINIPYNRKAQARPTRLKEQYTKRS